MATLSGKQRGRMPASSFAGGKPKGNKEGRFPIEDKAHVHDIHATILHALGLDHKRLTYRFNGRDERLTENGGQVIEKLFA